MAAEYQVGISRSQVEYGYTCSAHAYGAGPTAILTMASLWQSFLWLNYGNPPHGFTMAILPMASLWQSFLWLYYGFTMATLYLRRPCLQEGLLAG